MYTGIILTKGTGENMNEVLEDSALSLIKKLKPEISKPSPFWLRRM
jgi:hypothetical protein